MVVKDEGNTIGRKRGGANACKRACSENYENSAGCKSFAVCANDATCYLKDKQLGGSEGTTGRLTCKTYRRTCGRYFFILLYVVRKMLQLFIKRSTQGNNFHIYDYRLIGRELLWLLHVAAYDKDYHRHLRFTALHRLLQTKSTFIKKKLIKRTDFIKPFQ